MAEPTHTYKPIDTLVLRTNHLSILDTIFVSKRSRRAVYATTTRGPHTSLWRVAASGTMTEIAKIDWEYEARIASAGDGSLRNYIQPTKRCSMLTFGGRTVRAEEFLQKGKRWFSSDSSRTFSANNTEYKWKSGTENTGLNDSQRPGQPYHEVVKMWHCVLARPDSSNSSPNAASRPSSSAPYFSGSPIAGAVDPTGLGTVPADPHRVMAVASSAPPIPLLNPSLPPATHGHGQEVQLPSSGTHTVISPILSAPARPTLLARFTPPQPGLVHNEISLFSPALDFSSDVGQSPRLLECLLVSAVILAATNGEWKQVQSCIDVSSLQEIFAAEVAGDVPPYTPGARRNTTPGTPITTRNRTSRRSDYLVREESQLAMNQLVDGSDRVPLLPRRSSRQTSRSNPFTPPSEVQPSTSRGNGVYPSVSGRGAQRTVVSRRPITADSTPPRDGVFTRWSPSLLVVNAAQSPTWAPRRRPTTMIGMPSRPISSPPPMYK